MPLKLARLRRENKKLRAERDILKKANVSSSRQRNTLDQSNRATQTTSWEAVNEMLVTMDVAEATKLGSIIQTAELNPDEVSAEDYWRFARMA